MEILLWQCSAPHVVPYLAFDEMVNIIMAPAHVKSSLGLVHKIVSSLTETNEQINCYKKILLTIKS